MAEGPASALGKTQTFTEIRIVDALAATGQLSITHLGLGTVFRLLRADHASGQITGACDEDAQPPLGQPPLDGAQRQHFHSPARREDKVKLVSTGPKRAQRTDVIEGDRVPVEDRGVIEDARPNDARPPSRTVVAFGQVRRCVGWAAEKAARRAQQPFGDEIGHFQREDAAPPVGVNGPREQHTERPRIQPVQEIPDIMA
ncbi:hypothetical protein [Streptomyces sp. NPDC005407]|uniref:hypothetical protein n=1 Tax=Streptomyces sp. NPDC005407 TaxID=3155340 RepID=UPI0033A7E46D